MHVYIYTSGTRAQDHTQGIMNIYLLLYIRIYVLLIAHCLLLSIAYFPLPIAYRARKEAEAFREGWPLQADHMADQQIMEPGAWFMRHGHEMLWFLRGSFSESELTLSYNAFLEKRARAINWLRDQPFEQGMTIYILYI